MTCELAMIPIAGSVEDSGFTSNAWEGLCRFADERGIGRMTISPKEISTKARIQALKEAIENGAKRIVMVGHRFGDAVYVVHKLYPDIRFILIGGPPLDEMGRPAPIGENVLIIDFAEEQAGFLAGYAAVMEGKRHLAFLGGIESFPAIRRYGYGFLQGADYAAECLDLPDETVRVDYCYCGTVDDEPVVYQTAEAFCKKNAEVIFFCGGMLGRATMSVAERYGLMTIGVDVDQSMESATVLTSACKNLSLAVYDALSVCDEGTCGKTLVYDADKDGVFLPMAKSRFQKFDLDDYNEVYGKLCSRQHQVLSEVDSENRILTIADLSLHHIFVAEEL